LPRASALADQATKQHLHDLPRRCTAAKLVHTEAICNGAGHDHRTKHKPLATRAVDWRAVGSNRVSLASAGPRHLPSRARTESTTAGDNENAERSRNSAMRAEPHVCFGPCIPPNARLHRPPEARERRREPASSACGRSGARRCWVSCVAQGLIFPSFGPMALSATSVS
jgi:hypothetical protein